MLTHLSREQTSNESMDLQALTLADMQSNAASVSSAKIKLFDALNHLVTTLTLPGSLDDMLYALTTLIMQATEKDLCVILLKDKTSNYLRVHTNFPDFDEKNVIVEPVLIDPALWEHLHRCVLRGQLPQLDSQELEALNPLKNVRYKTLLPIPLIVGSEILGLINCYTRDTLHCGPNEQLLLLTVANQAALAIRHRIYVAEDELTQKTRVKAFVDDLFSAAPTAEEALCRRAHLLGCDLAKPHVVAVAELTEIEDIYPQSGQFDLITPEEHLVFHESVTEQFKHCIQEYYPGSLIVARDNRLICLLCISGTTAMNLVSHDLGLAVQDIEQELHVCLTAGISNLCETVCEYRRGYAEACEALELGLSLRKSGCTHFSELGVFRYIYKFAQADTLGDQYQDQVALIVEYDQRKKANLLDTLEMYLECGGNMAKTSSRLDVHRNTLLQRVDRLQKLCALDLELVPNRLPLLVAIKVHKIRAHCMTYNAS